MRTRLATFVAQSYLAQCALYTAAYAAVLYVSFFLIPPNGPGASLVWPPAALGLALLYFRGLEYWPAIALSYFVVLLPGQVAPPLIASTALGNSVESLLAAYVLRHPRLQFSAMLFRLRDALAFIFASFAGSFVAAAFITTGVYLFGSTVGLINTSLFTALWIGHAVSLLSFGSFALRWLERPLFTKTPAEVIEGVGVFGVITTLCILLFWTPYASVGGISLLYILIIPLLWAALRTGPRGISLALLLLALIGATGVLFGYGPIADSPNPAAALFGVQMVIGTLSVIFLLFTAITEERKNAVINLEAHVDELESALERINEQDQAKTDFIAILAHELRNPLSPLLSGVELLKAGGAGKSEVLQMMGAHLNTIARLLDDLLDISRISQKRFKLQKQPVEIRAVVRQTLEMVEPVLRERSHALRTELPAEDIWLSGDPVRLGQIFVNLLTNAAKYTDPGGTITLRVTRRNNELRAEVEDTGIGIEPERLEKIFEPFGSAEGARRPGGLRIGLSLARRMARMHHGEVVARSAGVNRGSVFEVRLPLTKGLQLPLDTPPPPGRGRFSKARLEESRRTGRAVRILLVDDNRAAADSLKTLLEHQGHRVAVAYDAPDALALAEEAPPQIALLDIGLPTMDGYRLGELLRGKYGQSLKLVALTGYGQPEDKQKAKDAGFDEHLVKPVSISDVEEVLRTLNGH